MESEVFLNDEIISCTDQHDPLSLPLSEIENDQIQNTLKRPSPKNKIVIVPKKKLKIISEEKKATLLSKGLIKKIKKPWITKNVILDSSSTLPSPEEVNESNNLPSASIKAKSPSDLNNMHSVEMESLSFPPLKTYGPKRGNSIKPAIILSKSSGSSILKVNNVIKEKSETSSPNVDKSDTDIEMEFSSNSSSLISSVKENKIKENNKEPIPEISESISDNQASCEIQSTSSSFKKNEIVMYELPKFLVSTILIYNVSTHQIEFLPEDNRKFLVDLDHLKINSSSLSLSSLIGIQNDNKNKNKFPINNEIVSKSNKVSEFYSSPSQTLENNKVVEETNNKLPLPEENEITKDDNELQQTKTSETVNNTTHSSEIENNDTKMKKTNYLKCCVQGCENRRRSGQTFFIVPLNREIREPWGKLCGIKKEDLYRRKYMHICSSHFELDFPKQKKLRPGIKPTLFLPQINNDEEKCCVKGCEIKEPKKLIKFPDDKNERNIWIDICGISENKKNSINLYVCDRHFEDNNENFSRPTLLLPKIHENENENSIMSNVINLENNYDEIIPAKNDSDMINNSFIKIINFTNEIKKDQIIGNCITQIKSLKKINHELLLENKNLKFSLQNVKEKN